MPELGKCRACLKPIRFVPTETGGNMPLDPDPVGVGGNVVIRSGRVHVLRSGEMPEGLVYVCHFATCPHSRLLAGNRLRRAADRAIAKVRQEGP